MDDYGNALCVYDRAFCGGEARMSEWRPVKDDGAAWKCTDCGRYLAARDVWHVRLSNGWAGIICKECIDPAWQREHATYNPEPI